MGLLEKICRIFRRKRKSVNSCPPSAEKTKDFSVPPIGRQYIVKINGQYFVYRSKDEMPNEIRIDVSYIEKSAAAESTYIVMADGLRSTYSSLDDMPYNVRRAMEDSGLI